MLNHPRNPLSCKTKLVRKIRDSGLFGTESLMKEIKQANVNIGLGYIARIFLNTQ